jgi:broad specificity phosphatase PhoE
MPRRPRALRSRTASIRGQIAADGLGRAANLRFDERLREISIGAWDGLDRDGIAALAPRIFDGEGRHEWYFRTPDGETYDDFAARIAAWLAEQDGRPVIAVTHGIVTRVMRPPCRIATRDRVELAGAAGPDLPPRRRHDCGD